MKHYPIFQPSAQDRVAIKDSGYPWAALLFSPPEADSGEEVSHAYRDPKRLTVLLENASSAALGETLTVKHAKTVA